MMNMSPRMLNAGLKMMFRDRHKPTLRHAFVAIDDVEQWEPPRYCRDAPEHGWQPAPQFVLRTAYAAAIAGMADEHYAYVRNMHGFRRAQSLFALLDEQDERKYRSHE
jgi:hypothetical protein